MNSINRAPAARLSAGVYFCDLVPASLPLFPTRMGLVALAIETLLEVRKLVPGDLRFDRVRHEVDRRLLQRCPPQQQRDANFCPSGPRSSKFSAIQRLVHISVSSAGRRFGSVDLVMVISSSILVASCLESGPSLTILTDPTRSFSHRSSTRLGDARRRGGPAVSGLDCLVWRAARWLLHPPIDACTLLHPGAQSAFAPAS